MADNQDPLSQLWLQQEVVLPDIYQVSKKWRKVRFKQRCYVVLDLFSVIIPSGFIWLNAEKLDRFTMMLLFCVMLLSVLSVAYIIWLRRFSLGWSNVSTDQHIQRLQKQIESNIKIANLSLHSVWIIAVLMIIFFAGLYYFEVFPMDRLIHKALITLGIHSVMLPCLWVWASKRKKRFSKELIELNQLLCGSNS